MTRARYFTAAGLLLLTACSGNTVRDTLGLNRSSPDEFRVVSRPPLSVPPEFDLQPPSTSTLPPHQTPASDQAQNMMLGNAPTADAGSTAVAPVASRTLPRATPAPGSAADAAFLKDAGANQADPQIRQKLVEQRIAVQEKQDDSSWWDIFSDNAPPKPDPVVDASKESQRIQKDEDSGQPVTAGGDTPVKKPGDTGVLGRLLGY